MVICIALFQVGGIAASGPSGTAGAVCGLYLRALSVTLQLDAGGRSGGHGEVGLPGLQNHRQAVRLQRLSPWCSQKYSS